jgi:hypothetical protein
MVMGLMGLNKYYVQNECGALIVRTVNLVLCKLTHVSLCVYISLLQLLFWLIYLFLEHATLVLATFVLACSLYELRWSSLPSL